jgi:tetratricopeptide (TPR) repeat protein
MSKSNPNRRHKRIVRAVSPEAPGAETTNVPAQDSLVVATDTPAQKAVPGQRPLDLRVIAGIAVVFVVLIVVILASSRGTGAQTPAGQGQPTLAQGGDAVFAGIDRTDIQALMRRGKDLYDQSRFDDAVTVYKEVLRLAPDNQAAQSNLGSTYFRLQRLDEALQAFREAVRLNPNDAEARQNLGAGLAATGSYDAAITEYIQATTLKPDLATAHYSLGVLYQETNNKPKAIEELTRYLQIGTDSQLKSDAQNRLKTLTGQ